VIKNEKLLLIIAEIKRVLKIGGNVYLCEAMTQGALYCQPFPSYQRLRPRKMYNWLFYPEILLADQGAVYHTHHLLVGTHRILPNDRPARIILDLGSGRRKDYYAIGVDLRVITRHGKKQTDVAADALHLPFVDGCADEVQCSNLLEHFENPYPLLIEISRVLKSEGQVVIDVPYAGTQSAEADPTHKFVLSAADWALVFSGFFGKIQCEPIGVRFQTSPKWKEWQERLLKLGFYDFGQGGRYFCTQPLSIPEFRYIPWWLEDYVKSIAGEDLV
jgi:SAM-dependent methyltransferase